MKISTMRSTQIFNTTKRLLTALALACSQTLFAETVTYLSPVYSVDGIYKSMKGPQSTREMAILENEPRQLLWITGYRAVMVEEDGETPSSQEFMCHSNLNLNMQNHRKIFGWKKNASDRLFTLSQGQFDIQFPQGFGIPVYSDESLSLTTQVLNLNKQENIKKVRHKVSIDFIRDRKRSRAMRPLFMKAAQGMVMIEGDSPFYNLKNPDPEMHGPGCLIGESAGRVRTDKFGRQFSGHWVVKPGREVNRTLATTWMNIPYNTKIHYIAVHLHPYAEYLELRDLTTGKSVFRSNVDSSKGKIGIDRVDYFSSREGVPIYANHEYEIVSVYNNPTDVDQDSMAVMYLYLRDLDIQLPETQY